MQLAAKFQMATDKPDGKENCPDTLRDHFVHSSCRDNNDQTGKHPAGRKALQLRNNMVVAKQVAVRDQSSSSSCSEFSEESNRFETENLTRRNSGCAPLTVDAGCISSPCNASCNNANSIQPSQNSIGRCGEGDHAMDRSDGLCCSSHGDELHCDPSVGLTCNHEPCPRGQDLMEKSHMMTTFSPIFASTPCSKRTGVRPVDLPQPNEDNSITALNVNPDSNWLLEEMTVLAKDTPSHLYGCGVFCKTRGQCNHSH